MRLPGRARPGGRPGPGAAHAAREHPLGSRRPCWPSRARRPRPREGDRGVADGDHAVHRPGPVHRLPGGAACRECDSHRGKSMIHLDYIDAKDRGGHADGLHAPRGPGGALRRGLPGRRHPGHRRRGRPGGGQGAPHRLRQLRRRLARSGCPSWTWPRCSSTSATSATTAPRSAWPRCAPPSAPPGPSSTARSRKPSRPTGRRPRRSTCSASGRPRSAPAVPVVPEAFAGPVPGGL